MKAATLEFLKQRFSEYYQGDRLLSPPSVPQREWAYVLFDPAYPEIRMRRHLGFGSREEVFSYIRNMAPAHAYYSSAYYANPGAPTMHEKGWLGADLIFDLDADHLMRGPYDRMLSRVKEETVKLLSMLTGELGFSEREMEVVFSGGRGYHIHVRDIAVRNWGSAERREVIDYVCGIGLDPTLIFSRKAPSPRGWHQRYIDALSEYLLWLEGRSEKDQVAHLTSLEGVGKASAEEFLRRIPDILSHLSRDPGKINVKDALVSRILRALSEEKEGEFSSRLRARAALADEPVTTDIKRLIRLPSSLHGGSGFRVTPLAIRELPDFDPLVDAVVFSDREMKVDCSAAIQMSLLGSVYKLEKGVSRVPEALAVFLCCRGMAEIAGGGGHAAG